MKPISIPPQAPRGLEMKDLDHITPEEKEAFKAYYTKAQGRQHVGFNYFLDNYPPALKRYRLFAKYAAIPLDQQLILTATNFANIAWYAHINFPDGIRYLCHIQQDSARFTREQVDEGLSIAFFLGGPQSTEIIATALQAHRWLDVEEPYDWGGDTANSHLLGAGLDYSDERLLPGELEKIEAWYTKVTGGVPDYVRLLARHRPEALKAYRNRWENLLSTLPVQLIPLAAIKFDLYHGYGDLLREHVLLCKHLGVSRENTVQTAISGSLYAGMECLNLFERTVGDILDSWGDDD